MNVSHRIEATMACLGAEVSLGHLERAYGGDDFRQALAGSLELIACDSNVRWHPGRLHQATQRLSTEAISAYLREQRGVSYSDAPNLLRLSVYLNGRTSLFEAASRLVQPGWSIPYFYPLDEAFWVLREDAMRRLVFEDLASHLWAQGGWTPGLQRLVQETPLLEELSIALALVRGEPLAELPSRLQRRGYLGLQLYLNGQLEAACRDWQKRARTGRKTAPPWPDLVTVLARLAALQCHDLVAFSEPRFACPTFPWIDRYCQTLATHLRGPLSAAEFSERAHLVDCGAGLDALFWRATQARLPVLQIAAPIPAEVGLLGLPNRLLDKPLASPWRMWLRHLRRGTQSDLARTPGRFEGYLSWRLWSGGVVACRHSAPEAGEPGRPVDLTQLAKNPPDYLSLQDRIVLGKMKGSSLTVGAVRALIGHPHLFFESAPCDLVERSQKLHLERTPGGLRLLLRPELEVKQAFRLTRLNERQVALTVASPWSPVLAPLLAMPQAVPPEGEAELREILAAWSGGLAVECGPGVAPLTPAMVRPDRVVLRVLPRQAGLHLQWVARDDTMAFPALRGPQRETVRWNGQACQVERDFPQEERWLEQIWDRCPLLPRELELTLCELDAALDLLEQLRAATVPMEWSQGREWKVRGTATAESLSLTSSKGEGEWFEVSGSLRLDDSQVLALGRALELARIYPGRYLQLQDGDFVRLDQRLREQLQALRQLLEPDGQAFRISGLAIPALEDLELSARHNDQHYADVLQRFHEAARLHAPIPSALRISLREYQEVGFRWLAQRAKLGVGACLADDMGLGKTIQVLALMIQEQDRGPHLVVCPTSVTRHWSDQMQRFCPSLDPLLYEGSGRRRLLDRLRSGQVLIVSYRLLLADQSLLGAINWQIALLDEAQVIKNPKSKTARASFLLKAKIRLATTGTPIENRLTELWSLFRFLNPGLLGSLASFQRRFEQTFERAQRPRLRRLMAPFLLRRMKSDVLQELPERTELTLMVELSGEERALYESVRRTAQEQLDDGNTVQLLAHLTRLRQACCHPRLLIPDSEVGSAKITVFLDLLDHLRAGGHRALVFSQFTSLLDLLEEPLKARHIDYLRLDGATPAVSRQSRLNAFQDGQGDLFLISLKAGGTGLNLTAADYVVHLDPWWNPAAEDQATDRAHRFGQTRPVTVYRILARDTIEEKVLRLHGYKRDLAREVLDGGSDAVPVGLEELRALVSR